MISPRIVFLGLLAIGLSACTSSGSNTVDNTLANSPPATTQSASTTPTDATSTTALSGDVQTSAAQNVTENQLNGTTQQASLNTATPLTFLPVQGAPQDKVSLLSKSLKKSATERQLNLIPQTQAGATYQVKGYFSALSDGSGTLLVYIWDVLDRSGKRVHRINGQERASTIKSDPWQAITDAELSRIADTTTARLKSWVDANGGRS